ncbi:LmbE family N-acetylglucosaminyl deacetylase [Actinocorallia herbida]|uniref:LmbE family N-acetylglucosaminyl deacetylase n=1 Tax=Actinocorallia herbida TaxID=58109 RepID=A0A3N1D704_9ACTN|nr:PIG-L deacetylase family protein [Actinocorallia herbida]ROO89256.1 LmbE family N-acetylglucosaminyl deacetylase [Actinocorallia herbida]
MEPVEEDWASALAIVAHPDDLEYGAAMAIARWTAQGKKVVEVLATRGEAGIQTMPPEEVGPLRSAEQVEAARLVGVDTVEFLDFPDGMLEYGLPLRRALAQAIRRHRPEVVVSLNFRETFGPGTYNMADHRVLGRAVADAVRDASNPWVFRDLPEPAWHGVRFALFANSPAAAHFVDVGDHLETGLRALAAHRVYLAHLEGAPDQGEMVTSIVAAAGRAAGVAHAVPFERL